mmetsp:Transcript_83319/g.174371  ORF Transcript_83319/g.174371 Transcript_83319/m.174371 type:complete len:228 (+) Transcript_83319:292-975(+)
MCLPGIWIELDGSGTVLNCRLWPRELQENLCSLRQVHRRGSPCEHHLIEALKGFQRGIALRRNRCFVLETRYSVIGLIVQRLRKEARRRRILHLWLQQIEVLVVRLGLRSAIFGVVSISLLLLFPLPPLCRCGCLPLCLCSHPRLHGCSHRCRCLHRLLGSSLRLLFVFRVRVSQSLSHFDLDVLVQVPTHRIEARLVEQVQGIFPRKPPKQIHGLLVKWQSTHLGF